MAAVILPLLPSCGDDLLPLDACTADRAPEYENVLLVPDHFATPQEAVDAAGPGDLVRICPGVYMHMETRFPDPVEFPRGMRAGLFMRDSVVVEGAGPPGSVVFRDTTGADTTFGVAFLGVGNGSLLRNVSVEDFFIGVVMSGSGGSLFDSRVAGGGAGVWLFRAEEPVVWQTLIEDCLYDGVLNQDAGGRIVANLIRRCGAGVGVEISGKPIVQANILCQNGLGLGTNGPCTAGVYRNVFVDNGLGMMIAAGAVPTATDNDIYGNLLGIRIGFYGEPLTEPIVATGNYWGTVDLEEIARDHIRDSNNDPQAGAEVAFSPVSPSSRNPWQFDARLRCAELSSSEAMEMLLSATGVPPER
jgi:hypothetical protein